MQEVKEDEECRKANLTGETTMRPTRQKSAPDIPFRDLATN